MDGDYVGLRAALRTDININVSTVAYFRLAPLQIQKICKTTQPTAIQRGTAKPMVAPSPLLITGLVHVIPWDNVPSNL